jgi:hypothetical protein
LRVSYELVHRWLTDWARKHALLNALTSLATFALAALLLPLTWYIIFAVCIFVAPREFNGFLAGLVIPAAVIALLFWTESRTPQEYFSEISVTPVHGDQVIVIPNVGSNVNPLAGDSVNATAKMISDCLCAGPRAVRGAFRFAAKAARLKRLNIEQGAAVLTVLLQAGGRKTYPEIDAGVEGVDLALTVPALRDIDGVVYLRSEPAGMSLTQELRDEVLAFARRQGS